MEQHNIAVIVGSLRKDSINRKVAQALIAATAGSLRCKIVEIGDLPPYDPDLDADAPTQWRRYRSEVAACDGILFVTPEYNRSIPGALKNAIDVGSRPYGKSVWARKPAAIVTASPGGVGGFGANHALRQCAVFLDMPMMQQPEAYLGNVTDDKFGPDGGIADAGLNKVVGAVAQAFTAWVGLIHAGRAALAPDSAGSDGA